MKKYLVLLSAILFTICNNAQEPFYTSYTWEKNPNYKKFKTEPSEEIISFKEKIVTEFYYPDDKGLTEYYLEHHILWLNSDEKIEDYNKIYLPYRFNSELLVSKARVITKDGKIQELDKSKILTAQDEETKRTYKYFAFEGVEKGSFIEYYYVVKQNPNYKGARVTLQSSFIKNNIDFDLFAPKNLVFKFKSFNGLKDIKQDTVTKNKLHWKLHLTTIDKLEKEDQAPYHASKKFLVYKLDYNTANNTYGISSYDNITKNVYDYLYVKLTKNETSAIEKMVKELDLKNKKDDTSKIRTLENYLKANFYISKINSKELNSIGSVITNKAGSEIGLMRIYIAVLKSVGVSTEVVLTSNRFKIKFDKEFEADNFLTDYLLYFPSTKKYTSAKEIDARLGYPPPELTDNYGLFIKEVALGTYKSGVGKIKYINPPTAEDTVDKILIDVSFNQENLTQNFIKLDHSYGGYYALFIQPFINMIGQEKLDKLYDQLIKSMNDRITIKKKTVYNDKPELFGIKPLRLVADIETDVFVDKAGRKYLFKLGELIGPQIEMYQKDKRRLPTESDYNRIYKRVLNVTIPKGYTITNLDDINIQHFYEREGKKLLEFHSYYKLTENRLTVYADEYYKINKIDVDFFEKYRSVINGAADFNKIVLILEPIKK